MWSGWANRARLGLHVMWSLIVPTCRGERRACVCIHSRNVCKLEYRVGNCHGPYVRRKIWSEPHWVCMREAEMVIVPGCSLGEDVRSNEEWVWSLSCVVGDGVKAWWNLCDMEDGAKYWLGLQFEEGKRHISSACNHELEPSLHNMGMKLALDMLACDLLDESTALQAMHKVWGRWRLRKYACDVGDWACHWSPLQVHSFQCPAQLLLSCPFHFISILNRKRNCT